LQLANTLKASLPALVQDYLDQKEDISECYSYAHTLEGVKAAAKTRAAEIKDYSVLVEVLTAQASASKYASKSVFENIEKLNSGAVTITTGHQLCVYGGPLFFFHKILSAVALSRKLQESGVEAVPVYWMASEDHDFEEINHVFINNEKVSWEIDAKGPVGHLSLSHLADFKKQLSALFANDPLKKEMLVKLDAIYAENKNLAEATRDFVYSVFGELGVVVIDADDSRLKSQFKPIIKRELEVQFSNKALEKSNKKLAELGYSLQVEGREINLFYMLDDYRERLVKTESGFATADSLHLWEGSALIAEVDGYPERFSPNVVLRPVYQEAILPNAAYIGGPGELGYWLQLKPVFDAVNCFYPAALLRDMVMISTEKTQKRLSQLDLNYSDAKLKYDDLLKLVVRKEGSHEHIVNQSITEISTSLDGLLIKLERLNTNLKVSGETERSRILKRLTALQKKVLRHDKSNAEIAANRIEEVKNALFPFDTPQERVLNWLVYSHEPNKWCEELLPFYSLFDLGTKVIAE
jgi:bacillithiol synthase